jgi:hypothetical protein
MVRRPKRSTSLKISAVEIVLFRCLGVPIRGLAGRPEPDEFVESTLPYVLNKTIVKIFQQTSIR